MSASLRIAAAGDLHCTTDSEGRFHDFFVRASAEADVIALCGDLTDYGLPDEATVLAGEMKAASVPIVAVLGNHDHEGGGADQVSRILREGGAHVFDGESAEIGGVGFAGAKGFGGGFGRHSLGAWGEPQVKAFVQAALDEVLKLETGLARLRTAQRVVLLHFSPVEDTVLGEPEPIYPFLGSSRLEEPINRLDASLVVHGHAHYGTLEGRTAAGIPVYNVSIPLLQRHHGREFRVIELPVERTAAESPSEAEASGIATR